MQLVAGHPSARVTGLGFGGDNRALMPARDVPRRTADMSPAGGTMTSAPAGMATVKQVGGFGPGAAAKALRS
jgi:hypothetical protein